MKIPKAPSVIKQRIDASQSITVTGISTGGIVGRFKKGPIRRPVYCESVDTFIKTFGAPEFTSGCKLGQQFKNAPNSYAKDIPEFGYAGLISTLYLKESQMVIVRAYGENDSYAGSEITNVCEHYGLSTTLSADDGDNPIVPELFDSANKISVLDEYANDELTANPMLVAYVSPGLEGNDVAVILETFNPDCDWKESYDTEPYDLTIKSRNIWDFVTSAMQLMPSSTKLSATSISAFPVDINSITFPLSAITDPTADSGNISAYAFDTSILRDLYIENTPDSISAAFNAQINTTYPIATKVVRIRVFQKGSSKVWENYYGAGDKNSQKMRLSLIEEFMGTTTHAYNSLNEDLFIEDAINGISNYIYVKVKDGINFQWDYDYSAGISTPNDGIDDNGYYVYNNDRFVTLSGGNYEQQTGLGTDVGFWDYFLKRKDAPADILIGLDPSTKTKKAIASVVAARNDCFCILQSNPMHVSNYSQVIENETFGYTDPTACALFAGYVQIYDVYSGRYVYVPLSGLVAKLYAYNDNRYYPWLPSAGLNRGIIPEAIKVLKSYDEEECGELFEKNINSLQPWSGIGQVVWGDKTTLMKKTYLDSISVVRTMLYLENNIMTLLPYFLWETNDSDTRKRCRTIVDSFMQSVKVAGGIFDYMVVCDDSNNPAAVIDSDFMNIDVYTKPKKGIRWIKFTSIVTKQSVSFSDVQLTY